MGAPPMRPLFLLGHWRSGTTLLHNLLLLDERFAAPTTFACFNPHHFLLAAHPMGRSGSRRAERPMGDMDVADDSPQEEEFALLCLGARSGYEAFMFPEAIEKMEALCDARTFSVEERSGWREALLEFLGGVSYSSGNRRLVLKSPTNSFRVEALRDLFPDASFAVIVRNPAEVFASSIAMWQAIWKRYALRPPLGRHRLQEAVIRLRLDFETRLEQGLEAVAPRSVAYLAYEELVADPAGTIRRLYRKLDLGDSCAIPPRLSAYLSANRKRTRVLPHADEGMIRERLKPVFEKYGFK